MVLERICPIRYYELGWKPERKCIPLRFKIRIIFLGGADDLYHCYFPIKLVIIIVDIILNLAITYQLSFWDEFVI